MRLDASAVTPGLANRFQKGTEPSAKSSQSGAAWVPKREQFACSCCAGAPFPPVSASARTAATRTPNLFTRLTVAASTASLRPAYKRFTSDGLHWTFIKRGRASPGLATNRCSQRENHHGAEGAGFSRSEKAPDSYGSLSSGESTSGISSASMSLLPELPPSSTPGSFAP